MTYNQRETPLFTNVKNHAKAKPIAFHIPSHKCGKGMDLEFKKFIGDNALSIDLINIEPLDDLHQPRDTILAAQNLAAKAFGAEHSFFSVQGTSGAIMAMIMSVCGPNDKIILPRNVHKSILAAIILSGAKPIFVHPELDYKLGIAHAICPENLERKLAEHPDAKAVLIINPTYYGFSGNLKQMVDTIHQYNIPVLIDEAHGAITPFHDDLPLSGMQAGADAAATSLHKLGGSLTQSSILNIQGKLINPKKVQSIMSMLTTTSTSYILLSSLDTARRHLAINGYSEIDKTLKLARKARTEINKIDGLYCPGKEILNHKSVYSMDETKVIIRLNDLSINAHEAERWLRKHHNIEVELSDLYNLLCLITFGDDEHSVKALIKGLQELSNNFYLKNETKKREVSLPSIPVLAMSPREAFYQETEQVNLDEATNKICAEFVTVYPPGIPVLLPGEIITRENIEYIKENQKAGLYIQGPEDPSARMINIVKT